MTRSGITAKIGLTIVLVGLSCFFLTILWPLSLSYLAWPNLSIAERLCWVAEKSGSSSYSIWNFFSNLVLAPTLESLPLLLIFRFCKRKWAANVATFLYGFFIHGLSVASVGKAFSFLLIYRLSIKEIGPQTSYRSLYTRAVLAHFVWNAAAMMFIVRASDMCRS